MKYKFIAELINENMEIIQEVEVKVDEDSALKARFKAQKKLKKQQGAATADQIWLLRLVDKKSKKLLPMQRIIKFLQKQIKATRSERANSSKKRSQFAEHRRAILKNCLLEANRELKEEQRIMDAFRAEGKKDRAEVAPQKTPKKKVNKKKSSK